MVIDKVNRQVVEQILFPGIRIHVVDRFDHSTPADQPLARLRTAKAHAVRLAPGTALARLAGGETLAVNSLHNQGIAQLANRLVAEAWAPDGTIEAVRVRDASGFALGVQWHPEYDWQQDAASRGLFELFGRAARDWSVRRHITAQAAE